MRSRHHAAAGRRILRGRLSVIVALVCASLGCNETLPPYADPQDLLTGDLTVQYVIADSNQVLVTLIVTNRYDETLQDTARFEGTCGIELQRDPSLKRTLQLSSKNLRFGDYNASTGILTIDRGDHVILQAVWDFVTDDGTDLRTAVFRYITDPTCAFRRVALPEAISVTLTLKVFRQTPAIALGPVSLSFCHIEQPVSVKLCPSLDGDNSCSVVH